MCPRRCPTDEAPVVDHPVPAGRTSWKLRIRRPCSARCPRIENPFPVRRAATWSLQSRGPEAQHSQPVSNVLPGKTTSGAPAIWEWFSGGIDRRLATTQREVSVQRRCPSAGPASPFAFVRACSVCTRALMHLVLSPAPATCPVMREITLSAAQSDAPACCQENTSYKKTSRRSRSASTPALEAATGSAP